jgi:hypothetical protein
MRASTTSFMAPGKSDIDVTTVRAPAILSWWASSGSAWLAPTNPTGDAGLLIQLVRAHCIKFPEYGSGFLHRQTNRVS